MPYVGFHLYETEREKELLHLLPGRKKLKNKKTKRISSITPLAG